MATSVNLTGLHINEGTQFAAANRLNAIFKRRKENEGLTQKKLAELMDLSYQSAVSHYMQGKRPLNTAVVLKFAQALNVSPSDIYPELMEPVRMLFSPQVRVHVRYALHGDPTVLSIQTVEVQEDLNPYAVEINSDDYLPQMLNGSFVICSARIMVEPSMDVFVETADGRRCVCRFLGEDEHSGTVQLLSLADSKVHNYPTHEITTMDAITGHHHATREWKFRDED